MKEFLKDILANTSYGKGSSFASYDGSIRFFANRLIGLLPIGWKYNICYETENSCKVEFIKDGKADTKMVMSLKYSQSTEKGFITITDLDIE